MLGIIVATTLIALVLNLILKKVHLPTIIGYILTGTIIAYTFNLHSAVDNHSLKEIAEFGVVFLMFTIGLEFSLNHLKKMKKEVFFTGTLQIVITTICVYLIARFVVGFDNQTSLIIGTALSLSSTAIVLKTFNETKEINKPHRRRVFGILIMQDFAVFPFLFPATSANKVTWMYIRVVLDSANPDIQGYMHQELALRNARVAQRAGIKN